MSLVHHNPYLLTIYRNVMPRNLSVVTAPNLELAENPEMSSHMKTVPGMSPKNLVRGQNEGGNSQRDRLWKAATQMGRNLGKRRKGQG